MQPVFLTGDQKPQRLHKAHRTPRRVVNQRKPSACVTLPAQTAQLVDRMLEARCGHPQ